MEKKERSEGIAFETPVGNFGYLLFPCLHAIPA